MMFLEGWYTVPGTQLKCLDVYTRLSTSNANLCYIESLRDGQKCDFYFLCLFLRRKEMKWILLSCPLRVTAFCNWIMCTLNKRRQRALSKHILNYDVSVIWGRMVLKQRNNPSCVFFSAVISHITFCLLFCGILQLLVSVVSRVI